MDIDIFNFFSSAYNAFSQSNFFYYLKIFSAFVSVILFIDIILLLSKRIRVDWRVAFYGTPVMRFKKSKYNPRWETIKKRLEEGSVASGKVAIVEADKMLDEALGKLGYVGRDTAEKVSAIKPGQLVGIDEVREIRQYYHKIVEDPTHEIGLDGIKKAVAAYERLFRGIELID